MAKHVQNIDFKISKSYYILPHSGNKHIRHEMQLDMRKYKSNNNNNNNIYLKSNIQQVQ